MNVEVYTLNAFAKGDRCGKPAGVVFEMAFRTGLNAKKFNVPQEI